MLRRLLGHGPHVELAFYDPQWSEPTALLALQRLVGHRDALTQRRVAYHQGKNLRSMPFVSVTDRDLLESRVTDEELNALLTEANVLVCELEVGANLLSELGPAILTFLPLLPDGDPCDSHPIALVANGSAFQDPTHAVATNAGIEVQRLFDSLVCELKPAYANISVEIGLPTISELRRNSDSYAFQDFFISEQFFGSNIVKNILNVFASAFIKPVGDGFYISTYSPFNPLALTVNGASWLSAKSAAIISQIKE